MAKANLGLATTKELIDELAARAEVASTTGETWPSYRTVESEAAGAIDQAAAIRAQGGIVLTVEDIDEDVTS
jgi:hypothetical protein